MNNPCYQCEFRTIHCHQTCERYRAFLDYRAEIKEALRVESDLAVLCYKKAMFARHAHDVAMSQKKGR